MRLLPRAHSACKPSFLFFPPFLHSLQCLISCPEMSRAHIGTGTHLGARTRTHTSVLTHVHVHAPTCHSHAHTQIPCVLIPAHRHTNRQTDRQTDTHTHTHTHVETTNTTCFSSAASEFTANALGYLLPPCTIQHALNIHTAPTHVNADATPDAARVNHACAVFPEASRAEARRRGS